MVLTRWCSGLKELPEEEDKWMCPQCVKDMEEDQEEDTRTYNGVFQHHNMFISHGIFGLGGPSNQVSTLPFMCFLARRDTWDIARAIGTEFQRFPRKKSISAQSGPQREKWPQLGQVTYWCVSGRKKFCSLVC